MKNRDTNNRVAANNRKAFFNYTVEDKYEAGIELKGTEVKSIRNGKISFNDSYADILNNEVYLIGLHITPYEQGNLFNHDPDRKKKLLLHKEEIQKLKKKVKEKGYTLVPLDFYLKNGTVKVTLGLCIGKKLHDKKDAIKERDIKKMVNRTLQTG